MGVTTDMRVVEAYDPGKITGWARGWFDNDTPLQLTNVGAIEYKDFLDSAFFLTLHADAEYVDHVVAEQFDLRTNNAFAADLTGVRVEGILDVAYEGRVVYRSRTKKSQVSDELLRKLGWWKTGRDVDWEDGRDANDAIIHLLGYVAFDLKHKPTLKEYFR